MSIWVACDDHAFEAHKTVVDACRICYQRYHSLKAREYRARLVIRFNEYKLSVGCAYCGYAEHPSALEFDHIVPIPGLDRSNATKKTGPALKAYMEDPNIQVLCANCHRIKTYANGDYKKKEIS